MKRRRLTWEDAVVQTCNANESIGQTQAVRWSPKAVREPRPVYEETVVRPVLCAPVLILTNPSGIICADENWTAGVSASLGDDEAREAEGKVCAVCVCVCSRHGSRL